VADASIHRTVRFGSFTLDPSDERLSDAHGPIHIGRKAYQVLLALVAQRGTLLTKDALFEIAWPQTIVSDSSLTSAIKELRRALGDEAQAPRFIEAVYGRGYRFIAEVLQDAPDQAASLKVHPNHTVELDGRGAAPSLAVLPFKSRSGLHDDDVFAEGLVEDLISALSQSLNVMILGSAVTAGLRLAPTSDIRTLGQRLGVRYLLDGNVRRAGEQLRVTAQILEASSGIVRWAGHFDRPLSELAQLQEDLVTDVAASLDVQVQDLELQRIFEKPADLTAWEALIRSNAFYQRLDAASLDSALAQARLAAEIAPNYAAAHAQIASASAVAYFITSPNDFAEEKRIGQLADHALSLGPDDPVVLAGAGCAFNYTGRPEDARRLLLRAVEKAPAYGVAHYHLGVSFCLLGRSDDAIACLEKTMRHFTGSPLLYLPIAWKAGALIRSNRWDQAEAVFDDVIALNPSFLLGRLQKAVCLAQRGQGEAARVIYSALETEPNFDHFQCETMLERIMRGSRAEGLMLTGVRDLRSACSSAAPSVYVVRPRPTAP
jgi:TolB-like protein/Flp pilus assembly protein TadD